jgi:alpha/beta superfamily hydrolase
VLDRARQARPEHAALSQRSPLLTADHRTARGEPAITLIDVTPGSVLPARREAITLTTDDGLALVGELALPADRDPVATVVCLHPLPTHGGMMDSHVLRKAANRLPALAGVAVLRFNTRGTASEAGRSEGEYEAATGERHDVEAAVAEVATRGLPAPWLLGWSFGTDLALKFGLLPSVRGAILLSPPLWLSTDDDLDRWAADGRPLVALVPELDDYLRPEEAVRRFARVPRAEVIGVAGARHLWVGEKFVRRALDEVVRVVAPEQAPVEWKWDA